MSGTVAPDPAHGEAAIERIAVIGAGLVGSSVARAATEAGVGRVVLTDADPAVCQRARDLGLGHEVVEDAHRAVADAELVVIATPAGHVRQVVEEIASSIDMQTIITDVASLKSNLVPEVEYSLAQFDGNSSRFVGGHPMAGGEVSGPEAGDGSLFQGATWILTPSAETDDRALRRL